MREALDIMEKFQPIGHAILNRSGIIQVGCPFIISTPWVDGVDPYPSPRLKRSYPMAVLALISSYYSPGYHLLLFSGLSVDKNGKI